MSYRIGKNGYYVVVLNESLCLDDISLTVAPDIIEAENYIIYGRYYDDKIKKCTSIEISPDATIHEMFNSFSDITQRKIIKISDDTQFELNIEDTQTISLCSNISNGCLLNLHMEDD